MNLSSDPLFDPDADPGLSFFIRFFMRMWACTMRM